MTYISAVLEKNKHNVRVWERTPEGRVCKKYPTPWYLYIPVQNNEKTPYRDLYGNYLKKVSKNSYKEFMEIREALDTHGIDVYEGDIRPEYKILSEHYYNAPIGKLNITFFDIEVDYSKEKGFANPDNPYAPISSVAIYHYHSGRTITLVVPPPNRKGIKISDLPQDILDSSEIVICKNEKELLEIFFEEIEDSDIISGWNSEYYDVPYIYERAERVLYGGAGNQLSFIGAREPYYTTTMFYGTERKRLNISGRVHLDFLAVYKKFEVVEKPSYALEVVAEEELTDLPKIDYEGSLYDLYRENFEEFIRYNIRDTIILKGLEDKKRYMKLAIQMSHMATAFIEDVLGTIKVAECSIINYCHDILDRKVKNSVESSKADYEGAIVLDPQIGMHDWIASIDIQSLYPSTMRSLNISPETIIGQFANDSADFEELRKRSDEQLVLKIDRKNATTIKSAKEWAEQFEKLGLCVSASGTVFNQKVDGVIPLVLTTWFNERKDFKRKMAEAAERGDDEEKEYYNNMQFIKKISLNAMYGACANQFFKFYDVRLARSTTMSARQILLHMAKSTAECLDGEYKNPSKSILYGDTDSIYFSTGATNIDDARESSDKVAKHVNDSFPQFMKESFLCDDNHNKMIKAEQEVISDRGIFVKKKYYMLHVVEDEGKSVDKMKNMGVPIKKTTLPKHIKVELESFIKRLLIGEDWKVIGKDVVKFKDKLKEMENVLHIGLPKGVKVVDSYQERYNAKEPNLRLPGHVAASMMWNSCLEKYGDKESPKIISGEKIYVYYLTRKFGIFKSIAIPKDISVIPDWFMKHFYDIIDRDAQIERLVDKPMEIMISAAGVKVPSKKSLLLEEALFYDEENW